MFIPRLASAMTIGVLAASLLTACTSGDDDAAEAPAPSSTGPTITLTRPSKPLTVVIKRAGDIRRADRDQIKAAIAAPIKTWIDGAFVGGDYPREDFEAGFTSWTGDAAQLAERDADTTSNAALGRDVVAVVADQQKADVFVFAEKGTPGGATARVALRLTEQKSNGDLVRVGVYGAVYLTLDGQEWKIFGYDLRREAKPA